MNRELLPPTPTQSAVPSCSLFDALLKRRSRRFAAGMELKGGPLAYRSTLKPQPLSLSEEGALAFAACGVTGYALAELPYETGPVPGCGGGNIMKQFVGRTAPSADALHTVIVFVINDEGTWMLRRPQDVPWHEIAGLIEMARSHRLTDLYLCNRVKIADTRVDVERDLPYIPPFNKWSANVPGTSYFICVNELTALYINILLSAFSDDFKYFAVDDRNRFRPAGIGQFAKSKGGPLQDDPRQGRFMTVSFLEAWLFELAAVEQGAIVQNLGLMSQALGLGGFPHFAAHPFGWVQALGFRMQRPHLSKVIAAGPVTRAALRLLNRDIQIPTAVGLEREGDVLIKPYCPPYYATMREAVKDFLDGKFGPMRGCFRDSGAPTGWLEPAKVQAGIPEYSGAAVDATVAYCSYIYERYGRFPAACGPFRNVLAYQAHHIDPNFYAQFYRPECR